MANAAASDPFPADAAEPRRSRQAVRYRDALRAMRRLRSGYDARAAMEFKQALEGEEGEEAFQRFLREPGASDLLAARPDLAATLDDFDGLARLPEGSLGRAYRELAVRDGIRAQELVRAEAAVARDFDERDGVRDWVRARLVASHDLLHLLTDYERDTPGELLLIAFTHAFSPKRVFRVSLVLGLVSVPARQLPAFGRDLLRARRRGRRARVPNATPWEALLPLSIAEARARIGIESTAAAHRGAIWREGPQGRPWRRIPVPAA